MAKKKAEMQQAVSAEESQKKAKRSKDKGASVEDSNQETDKASGTEVYEETDGDCDQNTSSAETACLPQDELEEDQSVLATMRRGRMTASEVYRVSQSFFDADIPVAALLLSQEKYLVLNTLEILSRNNYWQPDVLELIDAPDAEVRDEARSFSLSFMGCDKNIADDIVEKVLHIAEKKDPESAFEPFLNRIVNGFLVRFSRADEDIEDWIPPFVRLLALVDDRRIEQMLYDASECVRVAVLRFWMTKPTISLGTLVSLLILLRDRSDRVASALIQLLGQFALYAEVVIPALVDYYVRHQDKKQLVLDAIRRFKDDACQPLISLLSVQSDATAEAVKTIMLASPMRYLDILKTTYQMPGLVLHAKTRIADILRAFVPCVDQETAISIRYVLEPPKQTVQPDAYPKTRVVELMAPLLNEDDPFYTTRLDDDALKNYLKLSEPDILRLLNDGRLSSRLNAINLVRISGHASEGMRLNLAACLKLSDPDISKTAFLAYERTYEGDSAELTKLLVSIVAVSETKALADYYFEIIKASQTHVDNLIEMYAKAPKTYAPLVTAIMSSGPSDTTIRRIEKCFSSEVSSLCLLTTLRILTSENVRFDFTPFRKRLLEFIADPGCGGDSAFMIRKCALKILSKILSPGEHDQKTIDCLQGVYKKLYHPGLREQVTRILQKMDVEWFDDLDDDEDDFGDLDD